MQWTVRLEARTDKGEVKTAELVTFRRPAVASTLAEIGLTLAEAKALLTKLQASILCDQLAEYRPPPGLPGLRNAPAPQGPAHAQTADPVRHGRDRGAAVLGLPLPPVRAQGGGGVHAGL